MKQDREGAKMAESKKVRWSSLLWFFIGGFASFIWGFIASRSGSLIYWVIFILFLGFSIGYLINFLSGLVKGKGGKDL